jgi:pilus assembly protein CpaD
MSAESRMTTFSKKLAAPLVAAAALVLAGCSAQDIAMENKYQQYGGSDKYPIKVAHGKAHVKECGDWSDDATYTPTNEQLGSHGCAVQSNIAAMVADPTDFVRPGAMGASPSSLRTSAITTENLNKEVTSAAGSSGASGSGGGSGG